MKSILENRPALTYAVNQVAEVAGYLWQKGWAERNGGNITLNITEFVDDEIKALPAISEVKPAGALYVTTTITKWSDGSKTRDDDSMIIYAMKFGLIALAVIIVLWAARIVIVIATLLGLLRNYDWKQLAKDPKAMLNDLK